LLASAGLLVGPPAADAGLTRAETSLLHEINSARAAYHVQRLRVGVRLQRAARAHSFDMLHNGYFEHGPFAARMAQFGVQGPFTGENLAWASGTYTTPSAIVRLWLGSAEHRANLLRPGFRRVGVATPFGPFGGYPHAVVVTADFAGY
jgi:uncharacterized protein YkwD